MIITSSNTERSIFYLCITFGGIKLSLHSAERILIKYFVETLQFSSVLLSIGREPPNESE